MICSNFMIFKGIFPKFLKIGITVEFENLLIILDIFHKILYKFPKKERKEFNAFSLTDSYHSVFFLVFALGPCSQAVAFLFKPLELAASEVTIHEGPALFTFCKPNI